MLVRFEPHGDLPSIRHLALCATVSRMLDEDGLMLRFQNRLKQGLLAHRFALMGFAFPLFLRMIPDVLSSPYAIGYDTVSSYIPLMRVWPAGKSIGEFNPEIGGWLIF